MLKLIMRTEVVGQVDVDLFKTNWGYAVRYGLHSSSHAELGSALTEFANCVHHATICAGLVEADEEQE